MTIAFTRRRMIAITAAAAGCSLLPLEYKQAAAANLVTWRGLVMGAPASLQIHHTDRAAAEALVRAALLEVERLEKIFSLYRDDSALVELNRRGVLLNPASDLLELLGHCERCFHISGGAFDPTVQPLWNLYYSHFSRLGHDPDGPAADALRETLAKVGFDKVAFNRDRIVFARRGMGLTLNGIAQGFVTDRIVEVLRAGGIEHCYVDMGEGRALGGRADGEPWHISIEEVEGNGKSAEYVELIDRAIATSSCRGFCFDTNGRFNHLFDPRDGRSARLHRSVTVIAEDATTADAFSTAFSLMSNSEIDRTARKLGGCDVRID